MLPGQWIDLFETATRAVFRQFNMRGALRMATGGALFGDMAYQGATAQRGHVITAVGRAGVGQVSSFAGGAIGSVLGSPLGPVGVLAGDLVGQFVGYELGYRASKPIEAFAGFNRQVTRLRMGGDFEDYQAAYTMRQRAAAELGSLAAERAAIPRPRSGHVPPVAYCLVSALASRRERRSITDV